MPPNTTICRLCLSADMRTIAIENTPLQLVYEKLTSNLLHTADMRPVAACFLCHAQLSKSYKLMLTSARAENVLTDILETYPDLANASEALKDSPSHNLYGSLAVTICESTDSSVPIHFVEVKLEPEIHEFDGPYSPDMASSDKEGEKIEPEAEVEKVDIFEEDDDDPLTWPSAKPSGTKRKKVKVESEEVGASVKKITIKQLNKTEDAIKRTLKPRRDSSPRPSSRDFKRTATTCEPNSHTVDKSDEKSKNCQSTKSTKVNIFKCDICEHRFDNKRIFQNHLFQHTGEKPHACHICQRRFSLINSLKVHMAAHAREIPSAQAKAKPLTRSKEKSPTRDEDSVKCDVCQKVFDHKNKLRVHLKWHSEDRPFQCHACERAFREKHALTVHLRIHSGETPYECDVCHRKFNSSSGYYRHLRIHTGEKPYECEICKRRFTQISSLKSHEKTHTGDKQHECAVCHHRFYTKNGMLRHLTTHTGERPYECSFCQRRFHRDSHLKRHVKTHTGEKPHECYICHHRFIQLSDLKKHIRTHTGEKPFECNICQCGFKLKSSLIKHKATHTLGKSDVTNNIPETT